MIKIKFGVIFLVLSFVILFFAKNVQAAVNCTSQYGGGQICVSIGQLTITKQVWDPDSKQFVNNLGLSNHHFGAGEQITFQITVKNTGDNTLNNINVNDTLPSFLNLTTGSLSYTISSLNAGQSDTRQFTVTVVSSNQLPNQSVFCETNTVNATSSDNQNDSASSSFCLQTNVQGATTSVKTLPPTGPRGGEVVLALSALSGILGIYFILSSKSHQFLPK